MLSSRSRTCRECGAPFEAATATLPIDGRNFTLDQLVCDPCVEAYDNRNQGRSQSHDRKAWSEICDGAYLGFDIHRLPDASRGFASRVFEWQESPRGIGLAGPSRLGKTFVLTELFRRHYECGKTVKMVLGTEFAYVMGSPDQDERRKMIAECISTDMLFIDDIAKPKMTDRVEADLFHVLEKRKRNLKPVFVTLNGDGKTLALMLSSEGGNALVNRLRHDVCEFIRIDTP